MDNFKFVEFERYCPDCEYFLKEESEGPCYDCMRTPSVQNSHKPINFKKEGYPNNSRKKQHL